MSLQFHKPTAPSEDVLKQLVDYDVVILMDDSGSMRGSRWRQAVSVMKGVVKKAIEYDEDGIGIQFLNNNQRKIVKSVEEVERLFEGVQPRCSTPLGRRLGDICNGYLRSLKSAKRKPKRCLIVAITDGVPTDEQQVYAAIKNTANELDRLGAPLTQLGIQFVQIGNDGGAAAFLKELDDDLKGTTEGKVGRDIVDTVPYHGAELTSEELVKILIGAINRKVDNRTQVTVQ
ncbi:hypothetical protein BDM02DRAFT_3184229 [Thelephora ganbajun]|uniref:Uncharacterized protein n=1 Tax=Thelephora ganbajun TaxID=370292 RepID=A0ACB6ZQZ3_THEGA|nr:hypothetical protein BDM02DRAFT_3184229 [Thelephora ganbajun]